MKKAKRETKRFSSGLKKKFGEVLTNERFEELNCSYVHWGGKNASMHTRSRSWEKNAKLDKSNKGQKGKCFSSFLRFVSLLLWRRLVLIREIVCVFWILDLKEAQLFFWSALYCFTCHKFWRKGQGSKHARKTRLFLAKKIPFSRYFKSSARFGFVFRRKSRVKRLNAGGAVSSQNPWPLLVDFPSFASDPNRLFRTSGQAKCPASSGYPCQYHRGRMTRKRGKNLVSRRVWYLNRVKISLPKQSPYLTPSFSTH